MAIATVIGLLGIAGSGVALQALPAGSQVNDDVAAGINKAVSVGGDEPTNADVVGGALTAGKPAVPWAIFRQQETDAARPPNDQAFVRSFANGAWTTRGTGTVGGRSSTNPVFAASLNFDQGHDAEAPSIDFAGTGRTVPWATWYEDTTGTGFAQDNVFASRLDNTGDANQGKWIFGGQSRGNGGNGPNVPSLNIHTEQNAENPVVAGGSALDASKPGPWVAWQETANNNRQDQIFVSRPLGPGQANCDGVTPTGVADATGHVPAIGGFCFQQTGIARFGNGGADPSLNIDPTRNGVEPDLAFAGNSNGVQDGVPWVVWYEKGVSDTTDSLLTHDNEMVFAAKGVGDGVAADGGFHWVAVGSHGSATLDATANDNTNHFGGCAASDMAEANCSLNRNPKADAENPRVAAGTMNPANATVPWITWDEDVEGVKQVVVGRLVGGTHFELVNNGAPISAGANDSTRPDITFSGNTPYVTWREDTGGGSEAAFTGHFVNPANPTFVLDQSSIPLTATAQADVREPISSSCIATPVNSDGQACQGAALGTPFLQFTSGTNPRGLFAAAYEPDTPMTGAALAIGTSSATVSGSVDPLGAAVNTSFQFGTTTAYGQSTAAAKTGADNTADQFTGNLAGLPAGTTIHYRAVAMSDFGTFAGADRTLKTQSPPTPGSGHASAGRVRVTGTTVSVRVSCTGTTGSTCALSLNLTVTERSKRHRALGDTHLTLRAGQSRAVRIALNRAGRHLLATRHALATTLRVSQTMANRRVVTVTTRAVTFRTRHQTRHRGSR